MLQVNDKATDSIQGEQIVLMKDTEVSWISRSVTWQKCAFSLQQSGVFRSAYVPAGPQSTWKGLWWYFNATRELQSLAVCIERR
jgi:hypothetical protein